MRLRSGLVFGLTDSACRQVNSSTVDGLTPLSEACARGHVTCVSLLLRHGADPSGSRQSSSPIHRAAAAGQRSHSTRQPST